MSATAASRQVGFVVDGEECVADLRLPAGAAGPVPCVVMAHGFSCVRTDRLPAYAERFTGRGLATLVFDYRHFGDSGGRPRRLLDIGRQLDDWRAAVACARRLDGVDPRRVALWGTSFSGGHVVEIAAEDPSVCAVVAQVPFADGLASARLMPPRVLPGLTLAALRDAAAALLGRPPREVAVTGPPGDVAVITAPGAAEGFAAMRAADSPWENRVAARIVLALPLYRPVRAAHRVTAPLMVCVAERDRITPPGPGLRMARRAPRGEHHGYPIDHYDIYLGEPFDRVSALQADFLARHAGVDG
jgi:uncharacterized protein